jgi:signal transduction histidine kinase
MGQFLRELGHELGNLAFPLQMILDLQGRSGRLSPEEMNAALSAHVAELQGLTRRLQWIGRCLAGQLEPRREMLRASDVAHTAAAGCREKIEERRLSLQLLLPDESPTLYADRELLNQALAELLDNAARHTPQGGNVDLCVAPVGLQAVEFRICDTGPGMPAELRERAFDLLVHGHPRFDFRTGRVGCGLTLVQRIARVHGGSAEVRKSSAQGTEVVLTLPSTSPAGVAGKSTPTT